MKHLNDSYGALLTLAAQLRDKAANAGNDGKPELQAAYTWFGDNLDEALGIGAFKPQPPPAPNLEIPEGSGWVWSVEVPDAMRFVARSPYPHFQRCIRGLWQVLAPDSSVKINKATRWTVYSGSWPDITDQAWENALAGANRASKNTGRK